MSRLSAAKPAVRHAIPARVALAGPSGSGKTYTAILAAERMAGDGRILVIDTEHDRASLYADLAQFDTIKWAVPYDPRELAETVTEAGETYAVVVVDSLSHFWSAEGGTLSIVDEEKARSRSGNSFDAWRKGTPAQNQMVNALVRAPCHVIVTMRSKMDYLQERDEKTGKTVIRKVGLAPIQREDTPYELDVMLELDQEHTAVVTKSRCPALADQVYPKGKTHAWADTLRDWLNSAPPDPLAETRAALQKRLEALSDDAKAKVADRYKELNAQGAKLHNLRSPDFTDADADAWDEILAFATTEPSETSAQLVVS